MVPEVADRLAKLKSRKHLTHDDDLVFCNEVGARLCAWKLRRRFYRAVEKAGLPRIVFRSLRHCFGTHGIRTWDPNTLQGYMGRTGLALVEAVGLSEGVAGFLLCAGNLACGGASAGV